MINEYADDTVTSDSYSAAIATPEGYRASVHYRGVDNDGRHEYGWRVSFPGDQVGARVELAGDDLRSGALGMGSGSEQLLEALGGFLGAYAEAWRYGFDTSENRDLFPAALPAHVASELSDAIDLALSDGE